MSSGGFTKTWCGSKPIQLESLELDLGIVVLVLSLVLLPLLVLLEYPLLKVGFEPAVPKGDQYLAVEVGHHLEDSVVVCSYCVVKAILELLICCPMRIKSVKVKAVLVLNILSAKSPFPDKLCPLDCHLIISSGF